MANQREQQKARTRDAILRVAAEEFDAKGYVGAALGDIAARLNLTKGSVYFHFPSKAQLAQEIVRAYFDIWDPIRTGLAERDLTGLDALEWASREVATRYRKDVAIRAAVRLMRESALIDAEFPAPFVGWMSFVEALLGEAQQMGQLRPEINIEATAWHLVATFYGTQEVSNQLTERADLLDRIDLMWAVLRPAIESSRTSAKLRPSS